MRLDKYISECTNLSRSVAKRLVLKKQARCDQNVVHDPSLHVPPSCPVYLDGKLLVLASHRYIMLHKPRDTVCSSCFDGYASALDLIPRDVVSDCHFAGRLDADTTGLVIITSDGKWSHNLTSPNRNCDKVYRVWFKKAPKQALFEKMQKQFRQGVELTKSSKKTRPAKLELCMDADCRLIISEGRFHQVKRMFVIFGLEVVQLHRHSIGAIVLDKSLKLGQWRHLSEKEMSSVAK